MFGWDRAGRHAAGFKPGREAHALGNKCPLAPALKDLLPALTPALHGGSLPPRRGVLQVKARRQQPAVDAAHGVQTKLNVDAPAGEPAVDEAALAEWRRHTLWSVVLNYFSNGSPNDAALDH